MNALLSLHTEMNIFGENVFFLKETSFQDLLLCKATVNGLTASLVELPPFLLREITWFIVNLSRKLL